MVSKKSKKNKKSKRSKRNKRSKRSKRSKNINFKNGGGPLDIVTKDKNLSDSLNIVKLKNNLSPFLPSNITEIKILLKPILLELINKFSINVFTMEYDIKLPEPSNRIEIVEHNFHGMSEIQRIVINNDIFEMYFWNNKTESFNKIKNIFNIKGVITDTNNTKIDTIKLIQNNDNPSDWLIIELSIKKYLQTLNTTIKEKILSLKEIENKYKHIDDSMTMITLQSIGEEDIVIANKIKEILTDIIMNADIFL